MTTYSEKLKHPKWQKKRLEIMNRDKFQCQLCEDRDTTLNVHHKEYIDGADPWEYPSDLLITLCEDCHKKISNKPFIPTVKDILYLSENEIRDGVTDRIAFDLEAWEILDVLKAGRFI